MQICTNFSIEAIQVNMNVPTLLFADMLNTENIFGDCYLH